MSESDRHLLELRRIAKDWRTTDPASPRRREIEGHYRKALDDLYATGWDDALGWEDELPDERLPQRYLARRAAIIDDLESRLARFSMAWRRAPRESDERRQLHEAYTSAMDELFRIGHWSGEPDAESQLPYDLMPQSYRDFWSRRRSV